MIEPDGKSFWTSLPGLLAQVAAVITALALVITAVGKIWPAASRHGTDRSSETIGAQGNGSASAGDPSAAEEDLIARANGGTLVLSASANWDKMIDGDEDRGAQIGENPGDFGVFAFRDRRPARIGAFTTMVPSSNGMNPTALELSYATDAATGPFVPIGTFEVNDARVGPDGRQLFRFRPLVARFLKVKLRQSQSGNQYVTGYEFGALGTLLAPGDVSAR